ncbi:peptide ABC transporter permease [Sphaerisporangium krabiense]|uniref:Peptide/nickel transport system permease protein n=1 Tax=Sphaerisporangium krabiense TaxID=763782 RepID=A0A7W9DNM4_9ACTN|nr:ABC transporter permease [Sphaerisporangium krabiense]MBB5625134.1 peptide/nickel transport system permease protein [Sphaerisporangium krabiense]GII67516.1 peptide ABC transporter permease [Sphaerisporangium krabiense]
MTETLDPFFPPEQVTAGSRRRPFPVRGYIALGFIVFVAMVPFFIPDAEQTALTLGPPSWSHLLGTDRYGQDVLVRLLNGGQSITVMAATAGAIAVVIGTALGASAAYIGGRTDRLLMRLVDLLLATPALLVVLVMGSVLPRSAFVLTIVVGVLLMPAAARIIRAVTLPISTREFIASAEAAGATTPEILIREILPNIRARIALEWALRSSIAVLVLAALNFLGVGIAPPSADWGLSLNQGREVLSFAPWVSLTPAAAIVALVIAINVVADSVGERWL